MDNLGKKMIETLTGEINSFHSQHDKEDLNVSIEYLFPLVDIIETYKKGSEDPLTPKEIDVLLKHLKNEINLIEGNINFSEYNELERCINE